MKTFLVINGPNLEALGTRDPAQYGSETLADLESLLTARAEVLGVRVLFCQSNFEGDLVGFVNKNGAQANGIIINPAGLTKVGYSILDACIDSGLPIVEVHLSNIQTREEWRHESIFSKVAVSTVMGMRWMGYTAALDYLTAKTKEGI